MVKNLFLTVTIGVPGQCKNTFIEASAFEDIKPAILALNGIDRRHLDVVERSPYVTKKNVPANGTGMLFQGGGLDHDRVQVIRELWVNSKHEMNNMLVDLTSDNQNLIEIRLNTRQDGSYWVPFYMTVDKASALEVAEHYYRTRTWPSELHWEPRRSYAHFRLDCKTIQVWLK